MKPEREAKTREEIATAITESVEDFVSLKGERNDLAVVTQEDGHGYEGSGAGTSVFIVEIHTKEGVDQEGPFESAATAAKHILEVFPAGVSYTDP